MGGKTRIQCRTDLALDLKITVDTELSKAELNRSIERAISDLSRFLPREKLYEESLQFAVADEKLTMPADTNTDGVVADEALHLVSNGSNTSINGQPDIPRPLVMTITDDNNNLIGLTVTIVGNDENEIAVEETLHWLRGDSKTIPGKKYFKNVFMVYVDQISGAAAGDVLDIGWGAYTGVWVSLANKPIKHASETSVTDVDSNALARNTDFYIDYINGRIKAISGGGIIASDTVTISYTKSQLSIDLSSLPDFIRVEQVEYPVGDIPQTIVTTNIWGSIVTVEGDIEGQRSMAENKHIRVYYAAEHQPPNDFAPGSIPEFLENTVLLAASAYALYILAYKNEHQAATDLAAGIASLVLASADFTNLGTALNNIEKYLDNNTADDAAGRLKLIDTDAASLKTAANAALVAASAYLAEVDTTDLQSAEAQWALYAGSPNYLNGGTEPDMLAYLTTADSLINKIVPGGEGVEVPLAYARLSETTGKLISIFENRRKDFLQMATARTNAAMTFVQEAAQRLAHLRTYIERSAGYTAMASTFAREAEGRLAKISQYVEIANSYTNSAGNDMILADRFRTEASTKRDEAWTIWRDRKQYIGDFTSAPVRQHPTYGRNQ